MKHPKIKILSLVLCIVMLATCIPFTAFANDNSATAASTGDITSVGGELENPDFITFSDTHVFPVELIESAEGEYARDVVMYNKVLAETFSILEAGLAAAKDAHDRKGTKYLLLSGDLTANGERLGHQKLADRLRQFQEETGMKVYVINGNHDLNNYAASRYDENGNQVNAKDDPSLLTNSSQFAEIYQGLGYGEEGVTYYRPAINSFNVEDKSGNLSYAVSIEGQDGTKYRLIGMDTSVYSKDVNQNGLDQEETGCYMTDEHLAWLKEQTRQAVANGEIVLGLNHYAIIPHFTLQPGALKMFIYDDWEYVSSELADAGMHYILSGHMHASDITSYTSVNGETIYDIETGSLTNYANTYREISFRKEADGKIKAASVALPVDQVEEVDLTGEPMNGGIVPRPFSENYGVYQFMGTMMKYENGQYVPQQELSMTNMVVNSLLGYVDGRTYQNLIDEGGIRGILDGAGIDIAELLGGFLGDSGLTFSIITLKKDDVLNAIEALIDEVDAKLLQDNTKLKMVAETLVREFLQFEIAGHTLDEIVFQCLTLHYSGDEAFTRPAWLDDVSAALQGGGVIEELIDTLYELLLEGGFDLWLDGEVIGTSNGLLIDLLEDIEIDYMALLPNFGGIFKNMPTIRKLVLGSLQPTVITIVDKWAGMIIKDSSVYDTGSLVAYFLDGFLEDYLVQEQIDIIASVLDEAIISFTNDFNVPNDNDTVFNYDGKVDVTPTVDNYMLPSTIAVNYGTNTATTKNFNWITSPYVTGSDIQIIAYKNGASASDFSAANLLKFSTTSTSERVNLNYPTIDIGMWFVGENKTMQKHTVNVTGLKAGTKYCYRVGDASKDYWSEPATMETAAGDTSGFTFFHMADSQSQTEKQYTDTWANVVDSAFTKFPAAKFILHTGDVVDYGSNMNQWKWTMNTASARLMDTTMMMASGNHDEKGVGTSNGLFSSPHDPVMEVYQNLSNYPKQDTESGIYYDFVYNDAHFFVLNTNDTTDGGLGDAQTAWLKKAVQNSTATWKIVSMHKSIYSNGSHYKDSDVVALRNQLTKLLPELGIDIVFAGHDHVYLRTGVVKNNAINGSFSGSLNYDGTKFSTATNPDGTVYTINGTSGYKTYNSKDASLTDEYFNVAAYAKDTDKQMYSAITIEGGKLYYRAYTVDANGSSSLFDSFAISKTTLAAPKNVSVSSTSMTSNKLTWSAVSGAVGYHVYRATGGAYTKVATVSGTSYTDSGVTTGQTYWYKVVAYSNNAKFNSPQSAVVWTTPVPSQVKNVQVVKRNSSSVQVTWNRNADATGYQVYYSTSQNGSYKLAGTTTGTEMIVNGLSSGKTYYVKVVPYRTVNGKQVQGTASGIVSRKLA